MFFFNYNRINMNLGSDSMNEPINEFFRVELAAELRTAIASLRPAQREEAILKAMRDAIKRLGAQVEKFTYRSKTGSRSTHHLMCVSKHRQGMALFKEISAKESTTFDDSVPSMEHDPSADPAQGSLFSPLEQLEEDLLAAYAGQIVTPEQVYHNHHNGRPYILKNYRQALLHLEETGAITVDPPRTARLRSESLPHDARIKFKAGKWVNYRRSEVQLALPAAFSCLAHVPWRRMTFPFAEGLARRSGRAYRQRSAHEVLVRSWTCGRRPTA